MLRVLKDGRQEASPVDSGTSPSCVRFGFGPALRCTTHIRVGSSNISVFQQRVVVVVGLGAWLPVVGDGAQIEFMMNLFCHEFQKLPGDRKIKSVKTNVWEMMIYTAAKTGRYEP